jgi:formate dehydrogenase maturation protein FdhE
MDIGLFDGEWKIVEYNCANCSGVYRVDLQKLVDDWESFILSNVQRTKGKL